MAKLCYKVGGTVKKYDLKDSANTPRLAVKTGGVTKYLGLKQGTKSGELSVKVGGQSYYVQTLNLGNAVLDDTIRTKAFTQSAIFDRDYASHTLAFCFTNENKQIIAMILYSEVGPDRQGVLLNMRNFSSYFNPAPNENPGGTIKISHLYSGSPGSISLSSLVSKLLASYPSNFNSVPVNGFKNAVKSVNPIDNSITRTASGRKTAIYNPSGGQIKRADYAIEFYSDSSYSTLTPVSTLKTMLSSSINHNPEYIRPYGGAVGDGYLDTVSPVPLFSNITTSVCQSLINNPPVYTDKGKYQRNINLWTKDIRPYYITSGLVDGTFHGVHNGEGIGGWGQWGSNWELGSVATNVGAFVLGYDGGYPKIGMSIHQRDGGGYYCHRVSFIEFPGTQTLGIAPYDFINAWWTEYLSQQDETLRVTNTCNSYVSYGPAL